MADCDACILIDGENQPAIADKRSSDICRCMGIVVRSEL